MILFTLWELLYMLSRNAAQSEASTESMGRPDDNVFWAVSWFWLADNLLLY